MIDVEVRNGDVILSGSVGTSAEKRFARSDAWVNGVQSVDGSGIEVKWWLSDELKRKSKVSIKSDDEIEAAVKSALVYDPRVLSLNVEVDSDGRVVTLGGTVDNLKARNAAEEDAKNTIGVVWVENNIKVRPPAVPDDETLERLVTDALLLDPIVERHDFTVVARNGKVYLYGYVDSFYEKLHAGDVVSRLIGVVEIENNISVHYPYRYKIDSAIEEDIENEFFWSLFVDGDDITVSVEDGVATVSGIVDDWKEYKAVIDNAFEGGAKRVRNNLHILELPDIDYPRLYHYPDLFEGIY
jgi:osmotically-inducible protein OsmY